MLIVQSVRRLGRSPFRGVMGLVAAAFGIAFAVLATLTLRMPSQRNAPFRIREKLIRFGALGVGLVFLLAVLATILPLVLDALEQRGFSSFVGARHVRATKSGFLTAISVLSMAGVGVSSCALCSVTSIMGGFGHDLKRKILGNNAAHRRGCHAAGGFADWDEKLTAIRVALARSGGAATPIVGGEAMASSSSNTAGALVRGIDPETIGTVIDLKENVKEEAGGVKLRRLCPPGEAPRVGARRGYRPRAHGANPISRARTFAFRTRNPRYGLSSALGTTCSPA